jgi:hypothetical protein
MDKARKKIATAKQAAALLDRAAREWLALPPGVGSHVRELVRIELTLGNPAAACAYAMVCELNRAGRGAHAVRDLLLSASVIEHAVIGEAWAAMLSDESLDALNRL